MDGKETAKRKQVLEGNAFYEIDLECMRKKEKREEMEKREREARKPRLCCNGTSPSDMRAVVLYA